MPAASLYFCLLAALTVLMAVLKNILLRAQEERSTELLLAPTEVAYLSSKGNITFALAVLVFDMLHWELKNTNGQADPLHGRHWEAKLQSILKASVKDWTRRKVEEIVIVDPKANPVGFVRRLPMLYRLLSRGLKDSIGEILKDPRNLRKYFSMHGLMTIMAEISASGYKEKFQQELVESLLARNLLLSAESRKKTAWRLLAGFLICELCFFTLTLLAVPGANHLHALVIFGTALGAAAMVKLALGARAFIPLYEELHNVLACAPRRNFRVKFLTAFLSVVNFLLNGLSIAVFTLLFAAVAAVLYVSQIATTLNAYLMLLAMFLAQYSLADWLFAVWRLNTKECPSPLALAKLEAMRRHYSREHSTALEALKNMLINSEYDDTVAYLLAVWGLETLFFL